MPRNTKTRSVQHRDKASRKIDKALEAVVTADVKRAHAVWNEARACRMKLSKLNPIEHNPVAAEIAKIEIESLRKRRKIISGGGRFMRGNASGAFNVNDAALLYDHYSIPDPGCTSQYFRPTYAKNEIKWFGGGPVDLSGVEIEAVADSKTGKFEAKGEVFHDHVPLTVIAGFRIDFHLLVPVNPLIVGAGVTRLGRMQIIADFAPMDTHLQVASNGAPASSKGQVEIVVWAHDTPTNSLPVWHSIVLWNTPSWPNPLWESTFSVSRRFESPWFGANSMTNYSAFVTVRVDVLGNAEPRFRPERYGYAWGSIRGRLRSIKIRQCLLP